MEAGAFGLSSGLIYPPGCFSKAEEITELCRSVAERSGLYSTHMRSESDDLETAVEEALHVAAESHVRLQISHIKTSGRRNWGKIAWLKERLTQAKDQGLDFACDRYPYTAASTGLHFVLPDWAKEGGAQAERERLTSPPIRKDIADAVASKYTDPGTWQRIVVSFVPSAGNKPYEGKSISDVAQLMGCDPITAVFNLLVAENLNVDAIIFSMCEENLREILTWPFVAIGSDAAFRCTDGPLSEGKPHPRAYGTFSRILARYVAKEHVLTLPEAIRRMTLLPAQRVGLPERGAIKKGWHADLVVFDPAAIEDRATYEQPHQYSTGIRYVLVNGKIALRDGVPSGGLHGRILRKR
jgi:N-acyl-D-amino-acid deacylase